MIKRILASIEKQDISISMWLKGLIGIIFIRYLLETFSNHPLSYTATDFIIAQDFSTSIHISVFFLASALGLSLIIYFFTKYQPVYKVILFGLTILWFAPSFDIISTGGVGAQMTYYFNNNLKLFSDILSFFSPHINMGVTLGMRVEVIIALCGIGILVWTLKKNVKTVILSVLASFIFIFVLLALPGVIYTVSHPTLSVTTSSQTRTFIMDSTLNSNLVINTIHGNLQPKTNSVLIELGFDKLMSLCFYLLSIIFAGIWFFQTQKAKFLAVMRNSRPERVGFYLALLGIGMFFAYWQGLGGISNWVDIMSIIVLAISWYGAWMFAVHTNDIADIRIDSISNPTRPIINKELSVTEMQEVSYIWLVVSLLGAFSVSYYSFFLILIFTAAYYIYSAEPLRLKRFPIVSSFLISLACLSTILAGFFFISVSKVATTFPTLMALGIIIIFTLAVNIRDLKDVAGDKSDGIYTLPVIFGKYGQQIVAVMFACSFLLVPLLLSFYSLYVLALPASLLGYYLVNRKPFEEKYIFDLYFVFALLMIVLYFML